MSLSVQSPEDVINLALTRMGYAKRVTNIFEGSRAANAALNVYAQTRDALLREGLWDFSEKIAAAVASGHAPPFPWVAEYTYPVDCIDVRDLFGPGYAGDTNNPLPVLWKIGDSAAGAKVIWANTATATLVYTAQVTDPTKWEPLFVEALAAALARRLAAALADMNAEKAEAEDEKVATELGQAVIG